MERSPTRHQAAPTATCSSKKHPTKHSGAAAAQGPGTWSQDRERARHAEPGTCRRAKLARARAAGAAPPSRRRCRDGRYATVEEIRGSALVEAVHCGAIDQDARRQEHARTAPRAAGSSWRPFLEARAAGAPELGSADLGGTVARPSGGVSVFEARIG